MVKVFSENSQIISEKFRKNSELAMKISDVFSKLSDFFLRSPEMLICNYVLLRIILPHDAATVRECPRISA